jgi:hypothetical protein
MAVPQELLLMINNEDLDENIVQSFSQWRIDFPTRDVEPKRDDAKLQILSIAEKILTRGRITLASPTLEREFEKAFLNGRKLEVSTSNIYSLIYTTKSEHPRTPCLDSSEENSFYENILPGALGSNYAQFVIPQLEISSLISADINVAQFERVDFAIFHPKIANKIVVEIDGKQHERHTSADQERDAILRNHGFTVIRIPTAEIHKGSGSNLSSLLSMISITDQDHTVEVMPINKGTLKFVQSIKYNHQIQLALLQAIQSEFLKLDDIRTWRIAVDFGSDAPFDYSESLSVLITSVSDFIELIKRIAKLYSIELPKGKPSCVIISSQQKAEKLHSVFIAFSDRFTSNSPTFHVQNIFFPFHIANSSSPSIPLTESLTPSSREDLRYFLQYLFRKDDFWEGQYDGITRTLQAKDTLLLLPTGGGIRSRRISFCFHFSREISNPRISRIS